jgi:hypothetical protein
MNLSITDLRLWEEDHVTPKWDLIKDVESRIEGGVPCLLTVGLTRPYASRQEDEPVHWLQVNNLHLADDSCWRLRDAPKAITQQVAYSTTRFVPRNQPRANFDNVELEELPF